MSEPGTPQGATGLWPDGGEFGAPGGAGSGARGTGGPGSGGPGGRRVHRPGWKTVFFVLAAVAIVAGAGWALLGSRFLVVRSVQVQGTGTRLSPARVIAAARVPLGQPLIRVDDGAVARRVQRLVLVQSAQVSTHWPDAIVITVRLRVPVFAVAQGDGYAVVDRFGVTMRQTRSRPARLPLLTVGPPGTQPGSLQGSPAVRAAATVLGELPRPVGPEVRAATAVSETDVSVRLAGGTVIVWGDTSRARQKATELTILMRRHAHLYDVSAPGTAVTKG